MVKLIKKFIAWIKYRRKVKRIRKILEEDDDPFIY